MAGGFLHRKKPPAFVALYLQGKMFEIAFSSFPLQIAMLAAISIDCDARGRLQRLFALHTSV